MLIVLCFVFAFPKQNNTTLNPSGNTIATRFLAPTGYTRMSQQTNSFGEFLQNVSLKPNGTLVHYYNGDEKPNKVAAAVLTTDVGNKDLQQCADAVTRRVFIKREKV